MNIQPQHVDLGTLFHRKLFRIPQYQRAYSWQSRHRKALFDDIRRSYSAGNGQNHFMATVVGLRRGTRTILTDDYRVIDIVDGQQRITTLVLLYKAISKALDQADALQKEVGIELEKILVKQDDVCPVLLQTNHDTSDCFLQYLRTGNQRELSKAETSAERELLLAMADCEEFVATWTEDGHSLSKLVGHLKNKLTFILHELEDEGLVYTVFEVLNSRGLDVSWFDRLKSMLMAVVYESGTGNEREVINEVQALWSEIYRIVGLRRVLSTEVLRFAATLKSAESPNRLLGEEDAARSLLKLSEDRADPVIKISQWLKTVTEVVDDLSKDVRLSAVTRISHARLLAVAVRLNSSMSHVEKEEVSRRWASVTFRIFGMYNKDARTKVGDYVRLAWIVLNERPSSDDVMRALAQIGEGFEIEGAIRELRKTDCYSNWREDLRYLLYRYEEHLAVEQGQDFANEQWSRIWESNTADSIEHIRPQGSHAKFVHWLGNLMVLPPKLNSKLRDLSPVKKQEHYRKTGLLIAQEVSQSIEARSRWGKKEILEREDRIIDWAERYWAD